MSSMFRVPKYASRTNWIYESNPWDEVVQMTTDDQIINGRTISIKGGESIHFGNVSYVGLDTDERLKEAAKKAIDRYGVQFSSSRSFISLPLYKDLEKNLEAMYGRPVVVSPTTTLGHMAVMPLFIQPDDVVLMDYQAHASLQLNVEVVRAKGTIVELLPHNNMVALEEKIKEYHIKEGTNTIWYIADGVYSMFGDTCDMDVLNSFQDKYERLNLYLDDAHGISWAGKHGTGTVNDKIKHPDRTLLLVSLNKGIAAAGGAIVCPNEETKTMILRCGSSLVFSGPVQPSALAAAIASTRIHLSEEIKNRQEKVMENIQFFLAEAKKNGLVLADESLTPIFFVGVGRLDTGVRLCWKLREAGFYGNLGIFPAVPLNQTGVRISIHYHLTKSDISHLCRVLAELIPMELAKDNSTMEKVHRAFAKK